jgi:D-aminopeptidase
MAEVADHLVPTDGLTSSSIQYEGFDALPDRAGAKHRFTIYDEKQQYLTTFTVVTWPTAEGTIDSMVVEAHKQMTNIARQWLFLLDEARKAYEK